MKRRTFLKWGGAAPLLLSGVSAAGSTAVKPQNTLVILDGQLFQSVQQQTLFPMAPKRQHLVKLLQHTLERQKLGKRTAKVEFTLAQTVKRARGARRAAIA